MHDYSVPEHRKATTYAVIALTAALVAISLHKVIAPRLDTFLSKHDMDTLYVLLTPPSGMMIYLIFHFVYDRWLWKLFPFTILHPIPNLNGEWEGTLKTSGEHSTNGISFSLNIDQTYTRISLIFDTSTSKSVSNMAIIKIHSTEKHELRWEYLADAKGNHNDKEQNEKFMHYGVTILNSLKKDSSGKKMYEGKYYTEKERRKYGSIFLSKKR
jgi:hypothetical protein